ncbi:MAG: 30S ribosomal protein S12 methylthiotransferase RimO [Proteobacteria bacterium]|nr:30S ribosomal protein S12 methylthiotransferase RimO [Pseudomonadota bacterium]
MSLKPIPLINKIKQPIQKVHLVSLGCPKNRVDSEVMVGKLYNGPYELVDSPEDAEVIIVNTCSFIESATQESIDTVLDMAQLKDQGKCKKLIATGCMVQRYGVSLEEELPEVDFFLGTGEYHRINEVLKQRSDAFTQRSFVNAPLYIHDEFAVRLPSWKSHSAYLKISEGCNHRCTFCIIPQLRGKLRSRTISSLVVEAEQLAAQGVVELNLVSQDSTAYGRDLRDGSDLGKLLRALAKVDGIEWIRLHYAYPHGIPETLLRAIAEEEKVCSYIDIPLQHASGPMLRLMKRGVTKEGQDRILNRIRSFVPDVTFRTTFIVGFPGETESDFEILCDFLHEQQFDRVGAFTYFQEDGTPAASLSNQVSDEIKQDRYERLMSIQADISKNRLQRYLGTNQRVLVDGVSDEHSWVKVGRLETQAPEVDGVVFLDGAPETTKPGDFVMADITQIASYDLAGQITDVD